MNGGENSLNQPSSPKSQLGNLSISLFCILGQSLFLRFPLQICAPLSNVALLNTKHHHDPHQYHRRRHHHHHHFLHHRHCRDLHFFQMLLYWIATTALPVQKPNSGSRVRRKVECQRLKQALTFGPQGGGSSSFVFVHAFNTTKGKSLKKVWVRVPCLLGQCKLWDNCDLFGKNRVVVLLLG